MGQEISVEGFTEDDRSRFGARLARETALLRITLESGSLSQAGPRIGLELEAWLIDHNFYPAPHNQSFLDRLDDVSVVAELSRFNIEINTPVEEIAGEGLGRMHAHLSQTMRRCTANAHDDVDTVVAIGTLPTLREEDLSLDMMTPSNRYSALNNEAMRMRGGAPIAIEIEGCIAGSAGFRTDYRDVMLEAATTSLQLHLQLPPERLLHAFNASLMLSAPLVAISANSPFLFGRPLWHETRIPVFEQALAQPASSQRVTFGSSYAEADLVETFEENCGEYPVMLPFCDDRDDAAFACLRLHNGTLWRWVRPLVGFDGDGTPHLRIEQRVMPAGPSVLDMMANAAFYFGTVHELASFAPAAKAELPFDKARANFYAAARHGLGAEIDWFGRKGRRPVREVIKELLPMAERGLRAQGMAEELIDKYLSVIALRVACGRNGASWQLAHFERYGDVHRLTADYLSHQRSGLPVHEWPL
ncbi:glutamate-cysteine ligase family protein [Altererythrobacter arenosus]|uniref:Glutamate-cysteine ligase family protein n=1 Tax=Altererythrobacter arenosus TaxID=3032592 RepID=A0ABY8FML3_9SPHN|nr:glutamate-cysteine ligase family protein [Altererythrobacter sp. CAU 1644]WFL76269.1 glutamate-cysteine ligase family protein [Altererythrobacter sp. CAU 1644]